MVVTSASDIGLSEAIEAFVRGWSYTRSRTHPYTADRIGPAWVMRDAPRAGTSPKYRREEWVAQASAATEVHDLAAEHTRGRFAICVVRAMDEPDRLLRETYQRLGYRLGTTEPLMVHGLNRIPRVTAPLVIAGVKTQELAEKVAEVRRNRPREGLLDPDAPIRQHVALDGSEPIGWVESILVSLDGDGDDIRDVPLTWCSNMFVAPEYRRRGIGRALLSRMLRDDRRRGARASVLLASHAGAKLYPVVGYRQIGELLLFTPKR